MQQTNTEIHAAISPLIQLQIQAALSRYTSTSAASGLSVDTAAFLRKTGDIITGNIGVSSGVTIDGVDISVLNSYAVPLALTVTSTSAQSVSGHTHAITSSSAPGAAASILASDASGLLQLTGFGAGIAPVTGQLGVLGTGAQVKRGYDSTHYWTDTVTSDGNITLDPLPTDADLRVNADVAVGGALPTNQTEQLRLAYDDDTYASHNVDVDGVYTIRTTSVPATGAYMLLNPGGPVGVNTSGRPRAQVEIVSITEQLRLSYSSTSYATHTVSSSGAYFISTTGSTIYFDKHIAHPLYISQLSRWRISDIGEADFRYIYTDELHAKAFIADLEQALAGGQIVSKSVAKLAADFTVPDAGGTGTMYTEDFAGFAGVQVFQDGDLIRLRQFLRNNGGLVIADVWGTVVYLSAGNTGATQIKTTAWTFTRHATYPGTGDGVVAAGTICLDYGTSDNGYTEQNAIDGLNGANSPYYQIVTWNTHPKSTTDSEGLKLRVRLGQLRGLTGVNQWGIYAGTGWSANPNEGSSSQYSVTTPTVNDAHRYIIAGDNGVDIYNANLNIYSSTTPVITLKRNGPSLTIGSGSDTIDYLTTNGIFIGLHSGAYKMRVGTVSGGALVQGFSFDGSVMTVAGTINVLGGNALTTALIDANGKLGTAATPAGNGLHLGGTLMGYYGSGQWITYMDSSGNFLFRGTPSASVNVGAVLWDTSVFRLKGGYYAPSAGPAYGSFTTQWYTDSTTGAIVAGAGAVQLDALGVLVNLPATTGSPDTRTSTASIDFGSKSDPSGSLFYAITGSPGNRKLTMKSIGNKGINILSTDSNSSPTASASIAVAYDGATFGGGNPLVSIDATGGNVNVYGLATFESIYVEPWTAPTLTNSWVNHGGAGIAVAGYRIDARGWVQLEGTIKDGTTTTGTTIFTLPSGYRPAARQLFRTASSSANGSTRIDVYPDGTVVINGDGSNTYLSLDQIGFYTT